MAVQTGNLLRKYDSELCGGNGLFGFVNMHEREFCIQYREYLVLYEAFAPWDGHLDEVKLRYFMGRRKGEAPVYLGKYLVPP